MNKFERLKTELIQNNKGKMKAYGNSMLPILKSGSLLTFTTKPMYDKGDIVFCKVKGRYIDAHIITKTDTQKGYFISNNHGFDNGWTRIIFGAVCTAEYQNKIIFTTELHNETY